VRSTWRKAIDAGLVKILLQTNSRAHPELPKVPLSIGFAKSAEARQLIEAGVHQPSQMTYSYSLPPKTAKDRVQTLRAAFGQTMKDADFLNDAAKANLEIAPVSGEETEQFIQNAGGGGGEAEGSAEVIEGRSAEDGKSKSRMTPIELLQN